MRVGVDLFAFDSEYSGGLSSFSLGIVTGLISALPESDSLTIIVSEKNERYLRSIFSYSSVQFLKIPKSTKDKSINGVLTLVAWIVRNYKMRYWYDKYFRSRIMRMVDMTVDVLLTPTTVLNYYALRVPSILCIHDIQQEYYPELFSFMVRMRRWAPYRLSCWKAASIQVSSLYIKDCLIEKYKCVRPEKVFVAYEGVDFNKFTSTTKEDRPQIKDNQSLDKFVYYPAQLWLHKNHLLLIDALSSFRSEMGYELSCILTGLDYGCWDAIQGRIKHHGLKKVFYLGRVEFTQVVWLYRHCMGVLALGLHESSSLPVREGAVFGKPLICSNIPPNIEVQQFLHLRTVDIYDPAALTSTFIDLVENRGDFAQKSSLNINLAREFDWKLIAIQYLSVFKELTRC